jgi:hypothetical protein
MEENEFIPQDNSAWIGLFVPKNEKDLRRQYPELEGIAELKALSAREVLFVWYYACKGSKLVHTVHNLGERALIAIKKSRLELDRNKETEYTNGVFPEKIKIAIEKMKTFSPKARNRARLMVEQIFDNYENLVKIDPETSFRLLDKEGTPVGIDWTGRKQYIDSCEKIAETLPKLIRQIEEGFGSSDERKSVAEQRGTKSIDRFHRTLKDNE